MALILTQLKYIVKHDKLLEEQLFLWKIGFRLMVMYTIIFTGAPAL